MFMSDSMEFYLQGCTLHVCLESSNVIFFNIIQALFYTLIEGENKVFKEILQMSSLQKWAGFEIGEDK